MREGSSSWGTAWLIKRCHACSRKPIAMDGSGGWFVCRVRSRERKGRGKDELPSFMTFLQPALFPMSVGRAVSSIRPGFLSGSKFGAGAEGLDSPVLLRRSCQGGLGYSLIGNTNAIYTAQAANEGWWSGNEKQRTTMGPGFSPSRLWTCCTASMQVFNTAVATE